MEINVARLRKKIDERHLTLPEFSRKIGINPSTFYRKMERNGEGMTVGEVHKTVEVLELNESEAINIFLPQYSHLCE